jgi:flagellar biosynthetic protein FlhB
MVSVMSQFFFNQWREVLNHSFGDDMIHTIRAGLITEALRFAALKTGIMLAPILGISFVIGFVSTTIQTGFLYNEEALQLKWDRMDPVAGLQRMLNLRSLVEGAKSLVKLTLIMYISYLLLRKHIIQVPHLMEYDVAAGLSFLGSVAVRLLAGTGFFMLVLAAVDYFYQRWDLEKQMRMSKQEIKEEHKSREGDPHVKAKIKRAQREMAGRRMMEQVPKADVIVVNPTHIAIALKYDETMVSPTVIAKGADNVAEKIREIAKANNIPIVQNIPLARAMFKTLKLGSAIPKELYTAVAEVLSYVYKLRRRRNS